MLGTAAPPAVCHQCSSRRGGSVEPSGGEDLGREVPQHLQLAVVWNGQFFLSWDIYIYTYVYIQCSRIELKKCQTKAGNCSSTSSFAMQLACAAGFLSDAKCIKFHTSGFPMKPQKKVVVVSHRFSTQPAGVKSSCERSPKTGVGVRTTTMEESQPRPPGSSGP